MLVIKNAILDCTRYCGKNIIENVELVDCKILLSVDRTRNGMLLTGCTLSGSLEILGNGSVGFKKCELKINKITHPKDVYINYEDMRINNFHIAGNNDFDNCRINNLRVNPKAYNRIFIRTTLIENSDISKLHHESPDNFQLYMANCLIKNTKLHHSICKEKNNIVEKDVFYKSKHGEIPCFAMWEDNEKLINKYFSFDIEESEKIYYPAKIKAIPYSYKEKLFSKENCINGHIEPWGISREEIKEFGGNIVATAHFDGYTKTLRYGKQRNLSPIMWSTNYNNSKKIYFVPERENIEIIGVCPIENTCYPYMVMYFYKEIKG